MPKKLMRCIDQVQRKTKDKSRAYAICISSTGLKPHRRRKTSSRKRAKK